MLQRRVSWSCACERGETHFSREVFEYVRLENHVDVDRSDDEAELACVHVEDSLDVLRWGRHACGSGLANGSRNESMALGRGCECESCLMALLRPHFHGHYTLQLRHLSWHGARATAEREESLARAKVSSISSSAQQSPWRGCSQAVYRSVRNPSQSRRVAFGGIEAHREQRPQE